MCPSTSKTTRNDSTKHAPPEGHGQGASSVTSKTKVPSAAVEPRDKPSTSNAAKITSGNSCPQASSRSASIGSKRKARNGAYGEDTALTNARRDAFIAQRRFEAAEKAKERAKTVLEENPQGPGWAHKYGRTTVEKWIAKHQKAFENAQRAYVEAEKEYSEREKIHILYKGLRD